MLLTRLFQTQWHEHWLIKHLVINHFAKQFRLLNDTDWYDWQTSSQIRCYLNKYYITGFAEVTF